MDKETESPKPIQLKTEEVREHQLPSAVLGLTRSPASEFLYAACQDGKVYQVASETGALEILGAHDSFASSVHSIGDGSILVSGGYDGVLRWHDRLKRESVRTVKAHGFWSWRTAVSPDGRWVASSTGQYLCGGYDYEPAPEREPSVRVYEAATGKPVHELAHVPPVESIAISPDSRHLAAGNLMGEIRVWDLETGELRSQWTTGDFTGWGVIKGHYYTGGIFSLAFAPDGEHLLAAGMGSTRDPAAGNGKQLWQKFLWRERRKVAEADHDQIGLGLMESLVFHPQGDCFVMAGRLFNGKWNTAFFDSGSGGILHTLDTKMRTTTALFDREGARVFLAGTTDQGKPKEGEPPRCGRIRIHRILRDA